MTPIPNSIAEAAMCLMMSGGGGIIADFDLCDLVLSCVKHRSVDLALTDKYHGYFAIVADTQNLAGLQSTNYPDNHGGYTKFYILAFPLYYEDKLLMIFSVPTPTNALYLEWVNPRTNEMIRNVRLVSDIIPIINGNRIWATYTLEREYTKDGDTEIKMLEVATNIYLRNDTIAMGLGNFFAVNQRGLISKFPMEKTVEEYYKLLRDMGIT